MASERQIAANRRNAQKSTGPRSTAGRIRSGRNALRHGLNKRLTGEAFEQRLNLLSRHIAGDTADKDTQWLAHDAAEAALELERVRLLKATMIERVIKYGAMEEAKIFRSANEQLRWIKAFLGGCIKPIPARIDPLATMPKADPDRTSEAVRRLLPEFDKLLRYENRAAGRRDMAIRKMMRGRK